MRERHAQKVTSQVNAIVSIQGRRLFWCSLLRLTIEPTAATDVSRKRKSDNDVKEEHEKCDREGQRKNQKSRVGPKDCKAKKKGAILLHLWR